VAGQVTATADGFLERTLDGGVTWERLPLPVGATGWTPRLLPIHAPRPDLLLLWVDGPDDGITAAADALAASTDGGATWSTVFSATSDLPGLALSDDATTLLVSGPADGLWGAALDAALATGVAAFEQRSSLRTWGLAFAGGSLLAGGDDFSTDRSVAFTLGRSSDGGRTRTREMSLCDVDLAHCPATSSVETACRAGWEASGGFRDTFVRRHECEVQDGGAFLTDGGTRGGGPATAGDGGALRAPGAQDGSIAPVCDTGDGAGKVTTRSGSGCRCDVASRAERRLPVMGAAALVALLATRRQRRTGLRDPRRPSSG